MDFHDVAFLLSELGFMVYFLSVVVVTASRLPQALILWLGQVNYFVPTNSVFLDDI